MDLFIAVLLPYSGNSSDVRIVGVYDDKLLADAAIYRETHRLILDRRSVIVKCELNTDIPAAIIELDVSEQQKLTPAMWGFLSTFSEHDQRLKTYYNKSWLGRRFARKPKRKKW